MERPPDWMRLALLEPDQVEMCTSRRMNKWGYWAHRCTRRDEHALHVDAHTGGKWTS